MTAAPQDLVDHLLVLEKALQTREVRSSAEKIGELLSPDFREFGRSGLAYTFEDIITRLVAEAGLNNTDIADFSVSVIAENVALAVYRGIRTEEDGSRQFTNRSSLWRLDADGKWRMVFHQGTATA
ncbi:DUF4440 domain-containing protein [Rhizobium sp. XQZ8]|uniref:nuclear transport factor 2 family protein n=1 Tax=Rhizobium populisoli TaxID=2859785 RepID=UPI001CA5E3F9|nr:DUF4440 domain-containing protein [Rhizobium populisoli]MBW6421654.1 DUF4440 domain-containing protein [Rhizobium populisoli]